MHAYLALLVLVFGMFNKHCVDDGQMGQLKHKMDQLIPLRNMFSLRLVITLREGEGIGEHGDGSRGSLWTTDMFIAHCGRRLCD